MYIVATISKNSYSADKIEEIIKAGATVLRYNFSHGNPDDMAKKVAVAKDVIKKLGLGGEVKIMADLPGDKIRLGNFEDIGNVYEPGTLFEFRSAKESSDIAKLVPVDYENIGDMVETGQIFTLADGEMAFRVLKIINSTSFQAEIVNTYHLPPLKAINFGRSIDTLNHFTQKTIEHIKYLQKINPDWIAFSFVNSADFLKKGKALLNEYWPGNTCAIVSKIESQEGIDNIEEIAKECDVLLVARGDLALYTPIELLGINQKKIVAAAKKHGKQAIVSTQILDSLLKNYVPSRAEILDLTNIILDRADGIMLAKETGISLTPGRSVMMAHKIIKAVEATLT